MRLPLFILRTLRLPSHVVAFVALLAAGVASSEDQSHDGEAEKKWKRELSERSRWWSLQPPRTSPPPAVDHPDWEREPVDRFIRARLTREGIEPAGLAAAEVLARRLSFVLTGLPPKPERLLQFREAFSSDPDAAYSKLVGEFLASPHFGERFARHWMDVVRYTDTYGYEWDIAAKGSWEYRDYLIRAFNDDIGFDQLIREQIAGDLLTEPRINAGAGVNESLIGPMFYHFGEHRHGNSGMFNGIHQEMIDNKIDAFSKSFLAMTVACARCHDHKLDAISQKDYYALAGMFMTPRWTSRPIDAPGKHESQIGKLKELREKIRKELGKAWLTEVENGTLSIEKLRGQISGGNSLDEIGYPIVELLKQTAGQKTNSDEGVLSRWSKLVNEWKTTRADRLQRNAAFTILSDFSKPGFPDGWVADGDGIAHGYVEDGTPLVSLEGDAAIAGILPRGYHTHALSSRLPGAVRAPDPGQLPRKKARVRITGGEWAGRSAVPQNAFLNEGPVFFNPEKPPEWMPIDIPTELKNGVTRVLTDFVTASLHPNFPPRTGVARSGGVALPNKDDGFDKRSWFSLVGIVADDEGKAPLDTLDEFVPLYESVQPESAEAVWQRIESWLASSADQFAKGESDGGDVRILNWMLKQGLLSNSMKSSASLASAVKQYREVEATIAFSRSANSMDERAIEPINYRINLRGDVYQEGPEIQRSFLEVFEGLHEVTGSSNSGRLELANYLSSPENPQTARVYVNRVWQWIFGQGIVTTPSDFGKLGGRPSHPELLDWLAIQFMNEGWSTKQLVRRLVLSRAFRQSGEVTDPASERDPGNRLLHHYPTRRLEAEAIRDSLLAVSGQLDPKLYGRPIRPWRRAEDEKKRLFSGPIDGNGRRSVYLEMSIMQPPEFLVGFNLPDLKLPTGRRDVTNVPAQALILLNDPLVHHLADHWGKSIVAGKEATMEERIRNLFLVTFGREPDREETKRWSGAVKKLSQSDDAMKDEAAWVEIAHTLFNTKEFLYYR